jgi:hypothetical protein
MTRYIRLTTTVMLLAALGTACSSMTNRQTDASTARLAGTSVYLPGQSSAQDSLPDPYHYRCTGACLSF